MPLPRDHKDRLGRSFGAGYSYVAVGFQLVAIILLFGGGGWLVDGWLSTRPLFAIAGFLLGAFGWFVSLYYRVQRDTEAEKREREEGRGGREQ
jgi:F0F1-type ATP synthase assembly protein I